MSSFGFAPSSKPTRARFQFEEYDLGTMNSLNLPTKRRRGNPNRGNPLQPANVLLTEFEAQAARLGLTTAEYVASAEPKRWCDRNRNRVYVPEWLLAEWQMQVETNAHLA